MFVYFAVTPIPPLSVSQGNQLLKQHGCDVVRKCIGKYLKIEQLDKKQCKIQFYSYLCSIGPQFGELFIYLLSYYWQQQLMYDVLFIGQIIC